MRKILSLLCVGMFLAMTSCLDTEDPVYTQNTNYVCYNKIDDNSTNTTKLTAANYNMELDYSNLTVTINASVNLESETSVNLALGTHKLTVTPSSGYTFTADQITANDGSKTYNITNLKGQIYAYYLKTSDNQVAEVMLYQLSYIVDNKYTVNTINRVPYFFSQETLTTSPDTEPFKTSVTRYSVEFSSTTKADVTIENAQFVNGMPQISFKLKDLPVELTANGYLISSDSKIIPDYNGTPYDKMPLSNFKMNITGNGTTMGISYTCERDGKTYNVSSNGSIFPQTNN